MKKNKLYLIRFKSNGIGFDGWNSCYATSLKDAKVQLLKKVGKELFDRIDWGSMVKGKRAEELEVGYLQMFY
jgi:hypothetical protein